MLVGVDDHSDYPPSILEHVGRVGPDLDLDVDRVAALAPDLVIASDTVPGHDRLIERMRQAGLPLLVCAPRNLDDVAADMLRIGVALGVERDAHLLAAAFRRSMAPMDAPTPRPRILLEWWPKPVIVPGAESWATQMIALAGGENPWNMEAVQSRPVATCEVQSAQPDAIVLSWCGVAEDKYRSHIVRRRPGWAELPAVAKRRIFPISEALLGRPGPRLIEGLQRLRAVVQACAE